MQNGQFGSKLKKEKHIRKTILQEHYNWSVQKTAPKNTKYSRNETILKVGHFTKAIGHANARANVIALNIKNATKIQKTILQQHYTCSVQKNARKNTKYSRIETIFKIGSLAKTLAHAKAIAFARLVILGQKLKIQKKKRKTILQQRYTWSAQKTIPKNTKYSKNETISKIGHLAKAITMQRL